MFIGWINIRFACFLDDPIEPSCPFLPVLWGSLELMGEHTHAGSVDLFGDALNVREMTLPTVNRLR